MSNIYSKGEPLTLANPEFQVRSLLEYAPRVIQCREAMQNAYEAFLAYLEKKRQITVRGRRFARFRGRKLSVINSGVGLDLDEMAKLSNINNTLKSLGIIEDNRGEGIKVASCANNPFGIWWISRKDGVYVRSSIGLDSDTGTFKRLRCYVEGEGYKGAEYFTPTAEEMRYFPAEGDFVEVIFLGVSDEHDTFADPFNFGTRSDDTVWNDLQMRYYDHPHIARVGLPVDLRYQPNPDAANPLDGVAMTFTNATIAQYQRDYQDETVTIDGGVQIRYVLARTETAAKRLGTGGHMAVVYQSEKYSVVKGLDWVRLAPSYGITNVQNLLCVFVILPDDAPCMGDRYREHLIDQVCKEKVTTELFRLDIAQHIPKWLNDKMNDSSRPNLGNTTQKLKAYISQIPFMRKLSLAGGIFTPGRGSGGGGSGSGGGGGSPKGSASSSNQDIPGTAHPKGKSRAAIEPPRIQWLTQAELQDPQNAGLDGRIAEFRPGPGGGTLVINEFSPTFLMLLECFWREADIPESLRHITMIHIRTLLIHKVEYRLCQALMFAECQRGSPHWTDAQIEARKTPDAIENFCQPIFTELTGLKRNLMNVPGIKAAVAQNNLTSPTIPGNTQILQPAAQPAAVQQDEDEEDEVIKFPG